MTNLKKVLCLAMSMMMLLSVMVVGASAKTFPDQKDIQNTEAVNMAVALNIIQGRDTGDFDPTGNITRAEMAKMICILWNGGKEPQMSGATGEASYSDINGHWAEKYIEYCSSLNIIAGMGDGTFNPWGNVTGTQAAKMMLVCLGFDPAYEGFNGLNWSTKIDTRANYKHLYDDTTSDFLPGNNLTRDNAAQMVWNALKAYTVSYDTDPEMVNGQWTTVKTLKDKTDVNNNNETIYITLMYDKYDRAQEEDGRLTNFKYDDKKKEWTYTVTDRDDSTKKVGEFTTEMDFTNLYMQNVTAVFNLENKKGSTTVDNFYGMYADESSVLVSGVIGDIDSANGNDTKLTINDKSYKLEDKAADTNVYAFGQGQDGAVFGGEDQKQILTKSDELDKILAYSYDALDYDDDNTIDCIVVHPFAVAQIDYLTSTKLTLTAMSGDLGYKLADSTYDLDDDDVTLYKDAKEDDYVIVKSGDYTTDGYVQVAKADVVSGKATATKTDGGVITDVKVSDTWYGVAVPGNSDVDNLKNNDEYDLTVVNGYVFSAEKTKGSVSATNVLYVEKAGGLTGGISDGVEARVWFSDGTKSTVTISTLTMPKDMTIDGVNYKQGEDYDIVKTLAHPSDANTDEIKNDAAAAIIGGDTYGGTAYDGYKLYTYSEKGNDYSIEPISNNNDGSYDQYTKETNTNIKDGKTDDKLRFADDGVIFVHDKDGVKVVKGKTVTNWKDTAVETVYSLADKSNGTYYTAIGAIEMTGSKASSDARNYGFVTSGISEAKIDGTNYLLFDMWNGKETVKDVRVEDKSSVRNILVKYGFVAFDWEDQDNLEADTNDFLVKTADDAVAITSFVTDEDITYYDTDKRAYDFADDYFVIGTDTNKGEGTTKKLETAKADPDNKSSKTLANAIIFLDDPDATEPEVEAVFVDVNGAMYDGKNGTPMTVDYVTP